MKRFIVDQTGMLQIEASRRFVVEVPDHISEEQAQKLVEEGEVSLPEDDGMEWWDTPDRKWVGYDVEVEDTEVYDPETMWVAPSTNGLRVVRLEADGPAGEAVPE